MTVVSVRGIDEKAVLLLKRQAQQEGSSLNSLVVRLLENVAGVRPMGRAVAHFDDLDTLQGTWSEQDAQAFGTATSEFSLLDPLLWR